MSRRWMSIFAGGLLVVAAAFAALLVLPEVGLAASKPAAPQAPIAGRPGGRGVIGPDDSYLADALGITVEELNEAQQAAAKAAIQKAVDEGLITEAQAEWLLGNERLGAHGFPMWDRGFPWVPGGFGDIDREALLADALGISVSDLQAAIEAANDARLAQAVEDGELTQEQADMMKARKALQEFIQEKGFFADAVEKAVDAGVITQEQADAILEKMGSGLRGFGVAPRWGGMPDWGCRGRFGGFGRFGGKTPQSAPTRNVAPTTSGA